PLPGDHGKASPERGRGARQHDNSLSGGTLKPMSSPKLNYAAWDLTPAQQMIESVVREVVEQEALPLIPQCFEEARFPRELIPRFAELGLLGPTTPEYGAGIDHMSHGLMCQELERGDSALRSFASVQGSLCMFPISSFGSE